MLTMARGRAARRGGFLTWAMLVATVFVTVLSLVTSSMPSVRLVPVDDKGTPPGYPDVDWDRWPDWGVWKRSQDQKFPLESNWTVWTPSDEVGELVRDDRCRLGHVLHAGGPEMKATAAAALAGTDSDRRHAFEPGSDGKTPLDRAADRDSAAYPLRDPASQQQRTSGTCWVCIRRRADAECRKRDFECITVIGGRVRILRRHLP
jgi:Short repeats of unknown function